MSEGAGGYYVPKNFPRAALCPNCENFFGPTAIEVGDPETNGDKEFPAKCECGWTGTVTVRKYEAPK